MFSKYTKKLWVVPVILFSVKVFAGTPVPPPPPPGPTVNANTVINYNETTDIVTIDWNRSSSDVTENQFATRKIELENLTPPYEKLESIVEDRLVGSRSFLLSDPGKYSLCYTVTRLETVCSDLACINVTFNEVVSKDCGDEPTIKISRGVSNVYLEMDLPDENRDYDGSFVLLGGIDNINSGFTENIEHKIHNLDNNTIINPTQLYPIAPSLLSGVYRASSQRCPVEDANSIEVCSAVYNGKTFTIEKAPSLTAITVPSTSTIPSANIGIKGIKFPTTSLNARYLVSKRSRSLGGGWSQWSSLKTINIPTSDLDKAKNHVVSIDDVSHSTEHEFKVQTCNSTCSDEVISSNTLKVQYSIPSNLTSTSSESTNGVYNIFWGTSIAPNATFILKETNTRTKVATTKQYSPTGSTVNQSFVKTLNDTFTYEVKTCYAVEGSLSCTAYSTAITTTVDIQVSTPTLKPTSAVNLSIPLSWDAVSAVGVNNAYYRIYSSSNALLKETAVGVTNWTYTASQNGSYGFKIKACVPATCSASSALQTVVVDITPTTPALSLSNASSGHDFTLDWSASTRATSYILEHKYNGGTWGELTTLNQSTLTYAVAIPSASTPHGTHEYRVKACESSNNYCSVYSNVASKFVDTRPSVGNITIDRNDSQCDAMITDKCYTRIPNISLTWDKDTNGLVEYYQIYEVGSYDPLVKIDASQPNTKNIDGLTSGTYYFKYNACSNYGGVESCSNYSSPVEVQISIPAPVTQKPILSVKENGITTGLVTGPYTVEWNEVDRAITYDVYQKQHDSEKSFTLVATLGASDAVDGVLSYNYSPDLMAWGDHSYYIAAHNSDNDPSHPAPQSAIIAVTVEQDETIALRKQLYYSEADDIDGDNSHYGQFDRDNAAFRYLDLMYSFNSDAEIVVSDFFSGDGALQTPRDFTEIYDQAERDRINLVLLQLQENLRSAYDQVQLNDPNAPTRFTRSKELLLDVFYDRAVAEIVLGNQDMDVARIGRLREEGFSNEVNDLEAAYDHYYQALSGYSNLFTQTEYQYNGLLEEQFNYRKQESPRYWQEGSHAQQVIVDGSAEASQLLNSYKDLAMYFDLMSKVINTKVAQTKLEVNEIAVSQAQLDLMKQDLLDLKSELEDWTQSLQSKFKDTVFTEITALEVMQSIDRYDQAVVNINNATSWINGDTNVLGLNDDSLIIVSGGYGIDGNQTYYSYDAIVGLLSGTQNKKGYLTIAKEDFSDAIGSYENYRHNQDRLSTEYSDRNTQLNNLLVGLIGWEVPLDCHEDCVITSEDAVKGSQISLQVKRIEQADVDMETAVVRLLNLKLAIEDMVADEEVRTGIEGLINENILDYGSQQASISQKIAKIQARAAKARKKSSFLSGAVEFGVALYTQNYYAAATSLAKTASEMKKADAEIKDTKDIGAMQALSTELAAAERVQINEAYTQIRQTEFDSMIRSRLRDVSLLELEIEKAALSAEQEQERLMGLVSQAARLMTQIEQTNQNLADRYFADPIHASRLTTSMEKAERSFQTAQEWMFYAAQALEYKWLVDFSHNGYATEDILRARSVTDLEEILDSGLQPLDSNKNISNSFHKSKSILSLKEDVFGYHYFHKNGLDQLFYPHPAGDTTIDVDGNTVPVLLDADEAFTEVLKLRIESLESGDWLKIHFDTFQNNSDSLLFAGPEFDASGCIVEGGTYLDKIESIGVNIVISGNGPAETTNAYLSYGGTSYIRNKEPGIETTTSEGSVIDEFTSFPVLFWDDEDNDFDRSRSVKMLAALNSNLEPPVTMAFRERSVAASDWYVRVQLSSEFKTYISVEDTITQNNKVYDIELIFNHRYLNRTYDGNCQ